MKDLDLAHQIANGNAGATEEFVHAYYVSVYRFMRHLTKQVEDAEDLTQQAFIKAKQQIHTYRGNASLRTWLHRIAFHEYMHWKRRHRRMLSLDSVPPQVEPAYSACIESAALEDALGKLSEPLRVAFLLYEVQELSVEETARVLGVPKTTVKSRLVKARQGLCRSLKGRQETEIERQHVLES